jgi:hypothetical protein
LWNRVSLPSASIFRRAPASVSPPLSVNKTWPFWSTMMPELVWAEASAAKKVPVSKRGTVEAR